MSAELRTLYNPETGRKVRRMIDPAHVATCGECLRSWDDETPTSLTPAPRGRCPFEYQHEGDKRARWYVIFFPGVARVLQLTGVGARRGLYNSVGPFRTEAGARACANACANGWPDHPRTVAQWERLAKDGARPNYKITSGALESEPYAVFDKSKGDGLDGRPLRVLSTWPTFEAALAEVARLRAER